jgi:HTH-type transcriptional regulator/antitoxin HigA
VDIKPIRTKTDYRDALKQIESLMTAKANSPEGDRLDVLTTLVEAYERTHFPMDLPDAVEAIKFRMIEGLHTKFGIPAESLLKQSTNKPSSSSTKRS